MTKKETKNIQESSFITQAELKKVKEDVQRLEEDCIMLEASNESLEQVVELMTQQANDKASLQTNEKAAEQVNGEVNGQVNGQVNNQINGQVNEPSFEMNSITPQFDAHQERAEERGQKRGLEDQADHHEGPSNKKQKTTVK